MTLTDSMKQFILHWGEMGTRWGVNRTVAQVHALLYLAPEPLTAEEIADLLGIPLDTVWSRLAHARREFTKIGRSLELFEQPRASRKGAP